MKKIILSVFALVVAFVATADAQQKVFLNKGSRTVDAVVLGADDYISFGRPEGVPYPLYTSLTILNISHLQKKLSSPVLKVVYPGRDWLL